MQLRLAPTDPAELARAECAAIGVQEMYGAVYYGCFVPILVLDAVTSGIKCLQCFRPMRHASIVGKVQPRPQIPPIPHTAAA